MISIEDLVRAGSPAPAPRPLEMDPLREEDALQEVQLLDSLARPLTAVAALLFEMRTSLQFDDGNSALLVVRGLESFEWRSSPIKGPLTAMTILSSTPTRAGGSCRVRLVFHPAAELIVVGELMEFYVLDAEAIGDTPPDYTDMDLAGVEHGLPSWHSRCTLLQASISR
ncbi:hypothetical protein [Nocardiopsis potens]|uniref:hypothetical protein n=1 Tax=Nocardiopsis potens TaxID=1246458 RepID=UPI0012684D9E|nr:hypothetical protein [Nocardiopsis potens]